MLGLWSCTNKCTGPLVLSISDSSSNLIFKDFKGSRVENLRFYDDNFCTLIYDNQLYELNLHTNEFNIIFSDSIIDDIDFIQIANRYLKSDLFKKVDQKTMNVEMSSKRFDELMNRRKLINYWRSENGLFLIFQISTPKVETGKIIAENTYFIIEYSDKVMKKIIPILDETMSTYIKSDGIFCFNSDLYFSKFTLIYKDSLKKYSEQRPNLVIKYNTQSSKLAQVDLRFSKSELKRSARYLATNNIPYYQFINTAAFIKINNEFYLCDNKELFQINKLNVPKYVDLVDSEDEIVVNLPYSNIDNSDNFLYYTSNRIDSTKDFNFFISAYSLCKNKKIDQFKFNQTSLASNLTIFNNNVYFFRSSDGGLELNKYVFILK